MQRGNIHLWLIVFCICLSSHTCASEKRSHSATAAFKRLQPCPSTGLATGACKGYVIDHVESLACGGADDPSNLQWQTVVDAKAKDKWERKGCIRKNGQ